LRALPVFRLAWLDAPLERDFFADATSGLTNATENASKGMQIQFRRMSLSLFLEVPEDFVLPRIAGANPDALYHYSWTHQMTSMGWLVRLLVLSTGFMV
jgi:hypothetical protein